MSEPLVTTVIPTFERARMLKRAVESVQRQTESRVRICVYDDASKDDTREVMTDVASRDHRVQYYRHPKNIGAFENFKFGFERVTTPFFSVLADDDVLLPHFYDRALHHLAQSPSAQFAIGVTVQLDDKGAVYRANADDLPAGLYKAPEGLLLMTRRYAPQWTGMLFRRSVFETIGAMDARVPTVDLDFQLRAAGLCDCVLFHEPVALFNTHPGSTSYRLRHVTVWPGWRHMVANIVTEQRIPVSARQEAERLLVKRIHHLLPRIGWEALAYDDVRDGRAVSSILYELGHPVQAWCLNAAAAMVVRSPIARSAVKALYESRRWLKLKAAARLQSEFSHYAQHLQLS